ncbi:hypothetical protein [Staphylococcus aureus]|uniref:hypothetical protein n=1 Tax=Staphylococcus aureus TaxID=1280 RepID=UPI0020D2555E|nr:hypothetical protein [Staphylococcus aureus]
MDYALSIASEIYDRTALRHVCVDWYDNKNLKEFYCNNCGFKIYQEKITKKENLFPHFTSLSKGLNRLCMTILDNSKQRKNKNLSYFKNYKRRSC